LIFFFTDFAAAPLTAGTVVALVDIPGSIT
jgi:hypothetical protein